ncbi:MAG: hypothetical protein M1815_005242 [Lichina confinis]|nr:MAG: hypothetical protein M1815_005242 [Lichina confinis]
MTRRIIRTALQLVAFAFLTTVFLVFLDSRYRVLPPSIHHYLPIHHAGLVITDITVTTCGVLSVVSGCNLDPSEWHRIEKDLYLKTGWTSSAYVHVQRKREEELLPEDKIIIDVRISRLDPVTSEKGQGDERWESRAAGIWLKRSSKRQARDSQKAVTAVDILFGADAVEARLGWEVLDTALLLGSSGETHEARLTVRRGAPALVPKPRPRIGKEGKFKIMQVSDMHIGTGVGKCRDVDPKDVRGRCEADPRTLEFVGAALDEEKPDLVVLSGDQVNGETAPDAQSALFKVAELFVRRRIPYASIFGNHDDEGSLTRETTMSLTETLPYSLSEAGPASVDGVGNYIVEVLARGTSDHSALTLYLLDSHGYSPDERNFRGYDWIKKSQVDWFRQTAQGLKKAHKEYTHVHMDLAFIHIPLPEYRKTDNVVVGSWKEAPTAPAFNSGFRDALEQEGILMVSCGHNLWLCYAGGSGYGGYGGYGGYRRRVRLFEMDTNEAKITTWKRVAAAGSAVGDGDGSGSGSVVVEKGRVDQQIIVEAGKVVAP